MNDEDAIEPDDSQRDRATNRAARRIAEACHCERASWTAVGSVPSESTAPEALREHEGEFSGKAATTAWRTDDRTFFELIENATQDGPDAAITDTGTVISAYFLDGQSVVEALDERDAFENDDYEVFRDDLGIIN